MQQELLIRVENPTVPKNLPNYSSNIPGLITAVRERYTTEFPQLVPDAPIYLNGGDYGIFQPNNLSRAEKYAHRNTELAAQANIGYEPIRGKLKDISFLGVNPDEMVGKVGNFLALIHTQPTTPDSLMFIPLHGCGEDCVNEYKQDLASIDPGILAELGDITAEGNVSAFINNVVNSQNRMHACAMPNIEVMADGEERELPLSEAFRDEGNERYDESGVYMFYPKEDPRAIKMNGIVNHDASEALIIINQLQDKGIKSDILVSHGKYVVVPYRNDINLVVTLPDGTPWLPSGERLGFCLRTPNFVDTGNPDDHDDYIRGMYDAFNSQIYTNAEIHQMLEGIPIELPQSASKEYAEI